MVDTQYEDLVARVWEDGSRRADRTGVGTYSLFGARLEYDLRRGFPRITSKFVPMKAVKAELLWFLSGSTDNNDLHDLGATIWDEWAGPDGDLGPVYGSQWRTWGGRGYDQMSRLLHGLRTDPFSRRHVVSAWNVQDLDTMALPPCHVMFQCYVEEGFYRSSLSLQVYQRSADLFLGVPFNLASYALLTHMLAQQTGMSPGRLIWVGGDVHLYDSHEDQVAELLSRPVYPFPRLSLREAPSLFEYRMEDISASFDYRHGGDLPAPVAV